jgi:NAD-dependent SIR2 family protein deacetylase
LTIRCYSAMDQKTDGSSDHKATPYNAVVRTLLQDIGTLANFLAEHPRLVILTGAGISAESGIPTYRDSSGTWLHRKPIQEQDFLRDEHTRRRYWARSWHGWPVIRDALPNPAHFALAQLEQQGRIELLITQNVDGLHQRAGSRKVIDLHGRVDRVRCLACAAVYARNNIQALLERDNQWSNPAQKTTRPDGDMDIPDELLLGLVLPQCQACAGDLMPDVVFFGGSVPTSRVSTCLDAVAQADALLVVGSSLKVFSGYRFCRQAHQLGKPIVIINPGATRADELAHIKLQSLASPLLTQVVKPSGAGVSPPPSAPGSPS